MSFPFFAVSLVAMLFPIISAEIFWQSTNAAILGILYFLPQAVFFASTAENEHNAHRHLYIPLGEQALADSLSLIVNKDSSHKGEGNRPKAVEISLWIGGVKESSFYKGEDPRESSEGPKKVLFATGEELMSGKFVLDPNAPRKSDLLTFNGLDLTLLDTLSKHIKEHYFQNDTDSLDDNSNRKRPREDDDPGHSRKKPRRTSEENRDSDDKENHPPITRSRSRTRGDAKKQRNGRFGLLEIVYWDYSKREMLMGLEAYQP